MPTMRDNPRPTWSWMMMRAADLERQVYDLRAEAVERRCAAEDSGGARCTRDRGHSNNKHRHSQEDLPDMATATSRFMKCGHPIDWDDDDLGCRGCLSGQEFCEPCALLVSCPRHDPGASDTGS